MKAGKDEDEPYDVIVPLPIVIMRIIPKGVIEFEIYFAKNFSVTSLKF